MIELTGWGRYPRHRSELLEPASPTGVPGLVAGRTGTVARGNGRAYGDAAIGLEATISAKRLDRMRSFDPATGRLTVEAGVLLSDIIAAFLPRGFFPPVVPGTKLVTVGGMIAADVHGKNHHRDGGFGVHVEEIRLVLPGGEVETCSSTVNPELFAATIGGMGLTGTILEATFRLKTVETGWIRQRTVVAPDLDSAMAALAQGDEATYSVAWIDCVASGSSMGRSLIFLGEHASRADVETLRPGAPPFPPARAGRLAVPIDLPGRVLAPWTVRGFNEVYFRNGTRHAAEPSLVGWEPYFFPLDGIGSWNRIYGPRGFLQHQSVIPEATARPVLGEILDRISASGLGSFLAVLKRLGPAGIGTIAFPQAGYTLALDFRLTPEVLSLLDEIDRMVVSAGGRIYLAKDARQSRETFEAGYPALPAFRSLRRAVGAEERIVSRLSARLGI